MDKTARPSVPALGANKSSSSTMQSILNCCLIAICLGLLAWTAIIYEDLQRTKEQLEILSSTHQALDLNVNTVEREKKSAINDWRRFLPEINCGCEDGRPGEKGDRGPKGPAGRDGARGRPGPPGEKGRDGMGGYPGPDGVPGPAGADGVPGQPGRDGHCRSRTTMSRRDGATRHLGQQGPDGSDGCHGQPGPQGTPGIDGTPGADGLPGQPGAPGPRGLDGLPGMPGPTGPAGLDGADGPPGPPGAPAADGADGADGAPGEPGLPGIDGRPGRDASTERKFVRWGKHSCPLKRGGSQYYRGYAASVQTSSTDFSASEDLQCIPDDRTPITSVQAESGPVSQGPVMSAIRLTLLGISPPTESEKWEQREGKRLPCVVCIERYSEVVLSFGTHNCSKSDWDSMYRGYAMAPHRSQGNRISSAPICVDQETDANERDRFPNDVTSTQTADYSFIRSTSSFQSPDRLVSCIMCAKP